MSTDETRELKRQMTKPKDPPSRPKGLSAGSTVLNLALTGRPSVGYRVGRYYFFVGDSQSGKTFLTLTGLAEAAVNPAFDGYRFIYDNVEEGADMDMRRYYGRKMAERLEIIHSGTVEEFYFHLDEARRSKKPFIYILDSQDGLDSEPARKKFDQQMTAIRSAAKKASGEGGGGEDDGEGLKGSYGDGKAKIHSGSLRKFLRHLEKTGSILIIINQTRDKIGQMTFFSAKTKTRSGGHALKFYACAELWSSVKEDLRRAGHGEKGIRIGGVIRVQVEKNRTTGKERPVFVTIYDETGIDDTGSCVDYLARAGHWTKTGKGFSVDSGKITAPEFEFTGSREKLIRHIEESGQEKKLRQLVAEVWAENEELLKVRRKPRYE